MYRTLPYLDSPRVVRVISFFTVVSFKEPGVEANFAICERKYGSIPFLALKGNVLDSRGLKKQLGSRIHLRPTFF